MPDEVGRPRVVGGCAGRRSVCRQGWALVSRLMFHSLIPDPPSTFASPSNQLAVDMQSKKDSAPTLKGKEAKRKVGPSSARSPHLPNSGG